MKRPHSARSVESTAGGSGLPPIAQAPDRERRSIRRRRAIKVAVALPVTLALGGGLAVGAVAYARDEPLRAGPEAAAASTPTGPSARAESLIKDIAGSDESVRARARDSADLRVLDGADTSSSASDRATTAGAEPVVVGSGDARSLEISIGDLAVGTDSTGVPSSALPLTVTNVGPVAHSYDITVAARDSIGNTITEDVTTVPNLQPGEVAEVRVLTLVSSTLVERLRDADFEVTEVFAN